ncbi:MAG TPA: BamA/TamA family outer membrane protein, partial [Candidatus Manganitrophaceae bacterium]
ITEGKQVRVGRIRLEGNLKTRDYVLLREMLIHEGDPYDLEKILKSQQRLYRTGLFPIARFEPVHPEERPSVQDVTLTVTERPRIAVEFGVGYADYERLRGFFEMTHRNLWGTGRQISARAEGSRVEEKYTLNYKEPRFFGWNVDARLGAAYIIERRESFDLETSSGTGGFDKSFPETLKGSFLYQHERNRVTDVDPTARLAPEDLADVNIVSIASLNPSLIRDTRDDPFNPRSGSVNGVTFRDAAKLLGSEIQFVKTTAQTSWYFSPAPRLVLAFSGRFGAAQRFGETKSIPISGDTQLVPIPERFFLGGRSTVRGYDQDKLGVQGVTLVDGKPSGGNAMLIFNEELRIFLPKSFGLVFFFDHGNVWLSHEDIAFSQIKS